MNRKKYVVGVIIFWGTILISFIVTKQCTLQTGAEIILRTIPVDPRDLFRGDYVILRYDINRINLDSIMTEEESFKRKDKFYMKLDTSSKYARPVQISRNVFEQGIFIRGIVTSVKGRVLTSKYGIETYFVRQGTGREIEQNIEKIDVTIAVDSRGNALIKSLEYRRSSK